MIELLFILVLSTMLTVGLYGFFSTIQKGVNAICEIRDILNNIFDENADNL